MATNKTTAAKAKDPQTELDAVKADLAALREDIGELASALLAAGKSKAASAKASVEQRVHDGADALGDLLAQLKEGGEEQLDSFKDGVAAHPTLSVVSALALGYILGKVTDRS